MNITSLSASLEAKTQANLRHSVTSLVSYVSVAFTLLGRQPSTTLFQSLVITGCSILYFPHLPPPPSHFTLFLSFTCIVSFTFSFVKIQSVQVVNQNQATCIRAECLTSVLFSPCVSYKDSYLTHIIIIINSYLNHIKVHTRQEIFVLQTASSEPVDPHKWCGDQRYECPSSVECHPLRLQQVFFCPGSLLSNTEHGNQARFLP